VAASDDFADTEFGAAAGRAVAGFYVLSDIGEKLVKGIPGFFECAEGFGADAVSFVVEPLVTPRWYLNGEDWPDGPSVVARRKAEKARAMKMTPSPKPK